MGTYSTKKFEAPNLEKQTETQRAEIVANKFFDMADKINPHMASERQRREMFSAMGTEVAQGNYDKAQRNLEIGAQWDDNLRSVATEVNQLNQERIGAKPISFDEAQKIISEYARNFEKMAKGSGGKQEDNEAAMDIDNFVYETSEPGVAGITKVLKYIESTLKSKGNIANNILESETASREDKAEFLKDWQEKRAIRDALYQEKQKRTEQLKQSRQTAEASTRERGETAKNLEAAKRQEAEDQEKIKQIRAELGLEEAAKNSFQTLLDSPETYLNRLSDDGGLNNYSPRKAIGAVIETLQTLYPDKEQCANRIQEIFSQYGAIRDKNREERPNADEFSSKNFAVNQTAKHLSEAEREALEKTIKDKINISYDTFAGGAENRFNKEHILGVFINFLEGIKNKPINV